MPTQKFQIFQVATEELETKSFLGRDHLVVPVILLKEGVVNCMTCPTPELVLAKEFAKFEGMWNGRPITLGHPIRAGIPVSANTTDIFENEVIGQIFNVRGDNDKLKGDAWLDLEKIEELSSDIVERINDGQKIEVSTAYSADVTMRSGKFNGEAFGAVQSDIKPDHLAVLPLGTDGACSWEDGCGLPRLNQVFKCPKGFVDMQFRANSKSIKASCDGCEDCKCKINSPVKIKTKGISPEEARDRLLKVFSTGLSDRDTRAALEAALEGENDDDSFFFPFVLAVFDDTFIFEDGKGNVLERDFAINSDGTISLGEELTKVRPETQFVPVKLNEEIKTMSKKEKTVDALIANGNTRFTKESRDWLLTLEEDQLEMLIPTESEPDDDPVPIKAKTDDNEQTPVEDDEEDETTQTAEAYLSSIKNPEVRASLSAGLEMYRAQRSAMVKELITNENCSFSEEELNACEIDNLEKLRQLAGLPKPDYSAKGGPKLELIKSNQAPAAPKIFPKKSAN